MCYKHLIIAFNFAVSSLYVPLTLFFSNYVYFDSRKFSYVVRIERESRKSWKIFKNVVT